MNISAGPTDSLYKWMSIFGLTLFIFSTSLYVSKVWEYRSELQNHATELDFLSITTQWGAAIGFCISMWGFYRWYNRLQRYIDIETKSRSEEQEIRTKLAQLELDSKPSASDT